MLKAMFACKKRKTTIGNNSVGTVPIGKQIDVASTTSSVPSTTSSVSSSRNGPPSRGRGCKDACLLQGVTATVSTED